MSFQSDCACALESSAAAQAQTLVAAHRRHSVHTQPGIAQLLHHRLGAALRYLHHPANFLAKQHRHCLGAAAAERGQVYVHAAASGKRHLRQTAPQPAVRTVVQRQQVTAAIERTERAKSRAQLCIFANIRRIAPARRQRCAVHLRQRRTAQALLAGVQIHQKQIARGRLQRRGEHSAHIRHTGKAGGDERDRRDHLVLGVALAPAHLHRQRVLAHGDGNAQLGRHLQRHGLNSGKERAVLVFGTGGSHPVGRDLDVRSVLQPHARQVGNHLRQRHARGRLAADERQRGAQSATGVCQGPTIWSRTLMPPTLRSPMVMRNCLLATLGSCSTHSRLCCRSSWAITSLTVLAASAPSAG